MNKSNILAQSLLLLICAIFINTKSIAEPENLGLHKIELKEYYASGQYLKELKSVANKADLYILHEAQVNFKHKKPQKLAIVLDIDETVLSNYNSIESHDFGYDKVAFFKDIQKAKNPALKPMLSLYKDSLKNNIAVFFVTGRHQSEKQFTINNLKYAGFTTWTGIYFRPKNYNEQSIIPYKTAAREAITKEGYTIIASIGDQKSDLIGGYAKQTFKLPNPYYFIG